MIFDCEFKKKVQLYELNAIHKVLETNYCNINDKEIYVTCN